VLRAIRRRALAVEVMIERVFLDWGEPMLPAVASWLIDRFGSSDGEVVDMQSIVCVLPGRRGGRILLELLVRRCEAEDRDLIPPRMFTPGVLGDVLLEIEDAVASAIERELAWVRALRESDPESIAALLPQRPDETDPLAWHELARMISAIHDELAGARIDFSEVADRAGRLEMFAESDRWAALGTVADRYRAILSACGLTDPNEAQERALRAGARTDGSGVILVGVTDLNAVQRAVLERAAGRCTALVHAPASIGERFDEFGCVRAETWTALNIDVPDDAIEIAVRPGDQAQAALRAIASLDGERSSEEITIGLGDRAMSDAIVRAAELAGLQVHDAGGHPLMRTGPYRLLESMAAWLEAPRFAPFAALVRHPDLETWLRRYLEEREIDGDVDRGIEDWISLLDRYFTDHLHERLTGAWLGDERVQRRLGSIWDAVHELLAPLDRRPSRLGEWCEPIVEVIARVYGGREPTESDGRIRRSVAACLKLKEMLDRLSGTTAALLPSVDAATALRFLLASTSDDQIASEVRADEIEMLGWLELHLDPAPILILTGCNDGAIPEAIGADPFLPNGLRRAVGLMDDEQRYARDAYLLSAVLASRERVTLITGRVDAEGNPLQPSRLLLACDDETLLARVKRLCAEEHRARPLPIGASRPAERSRFTVPDLPAALALPESMAVTEFRQYLACPYRYALGRLLRLKPSADDAAELDALRFGSLVHAVLEAFGRDGEIRDSADSAAIEAFLLDELGRHAVSWFGRDPMPAVRLQLARIEQRLTTFAELQAQLRADGWIIDRVEYEFPDDSVLHIPGEAQMPLRGKIDRIDRNEETGAWRIIDYKTGEAGKSPHETHHGRKHLPQDLSELEWLDLQLPLYQYLAHQHGITGPAELGFIVLPKKADDVAWKAAQWTIEHLESALETARRVVRDIRAGAFDMNQDYEARFDDFARICQTTAFVEIDDESAEFAEADA
jgi:ATP-dependent helicase/nuclease subunit B